LAHNKKTHLNTPTNRRLLTDNFSSEEQQPQIMLEPKSIQIEAEQPKIIKVESKKENNSTPNFGFMDPSFFEGF